MKQHHDQDCHETAGNSGIMRVCAYCRVSTTRQAEADLSIPDQREQIRAFVATKRWNLVAEYVDPGASARDEDRPEFQKMIERATDADRPFDVIVVHSYSRFFRDLFGLELHIRKLRKTGVRLVSITQELNDDPSAVMMRQMIAMFDEYQSRENAKHTLRAMKENARRGFYNGSPLPLGYRTEEAEHRGTKVKKRLAIDPVQAELVKYIYELYLRGDGKSGPLGIKEVVKRLNAQGHRTRTGARFGVGSLQHTLTNTVYIGEWVFNRRESRTGRQKPACEQVVVSVPAIIGRADFDDVQTKLKAHNWRVTPPRIVNSPILLSGLAVCATCNGAMTLRTGTSRTGTTHRYYTCSNSARMGKTACSGRSMPMYKLDRLVIEHLEQKLLTTERLSEMLVELSGRRAKSAAEVDQRMVALTRERVEAEEKLRRLYKLVEDGSSDIDDMLRNRITTLKTERDLAAAALDRIRVHAIPASDIPLDVVERFAMAMRENIGSENAPFARAYLRSIVDRIEVDDHEIRIIGDKSTVAQAIAGHETGQSRVRSFERNWRPLGDSNSCYRRERAVTGVILSRITHNISWFFSVLKKYDDA